MKKTFGGNRLGSGGKMQVELPEFGKSTHNLSHAWRSSATHGVLYPFMHEIALPGSSFEINLNTAIFTMPTKFPVFGSEKVQLDVFQIPLRLIQGMLHGNYTELGLNASKVLFPRIKLPQITRQKWSKNNPLYRTNPSSLNCYLGIKGFGQLGQMAAVAQLNKCGMLHIMLYDIYKNYYANLQEGTGQAIAAVEKIRVVETFSIITAAENSAVLNGSYNVDPKTIRLEGQTYTYGMKTVVQPADIYVAAGQVVQLQINERNVNINSISCQMENNDGTVQSVRLVDLLSNLDANSSIQVEKITRRSATPEGDKRLRRYNNSAGSGTAGASQPIVQPSEPEFVITEKGQYIFTPKSNTEIVNAEGVMHIVGFTTNAITEAKITTETQIETFPLENIDNARKTILKAQELNTQVWIQRDGSKTENIINWPPYSINARTKQVDQQEKTGMIELLDGPLNGLPIKTFQSDMFTNFLNTEWIDGVNGINAVTAVSTENNAFQIDTLQLAYKVYNMLNRIAISDGSYQGWLEAVYGQRAARYVEKPIYLGGMSTELIFDTVVSTATTETIEDGYQPSGSLSGRGVLSNKKGGYIKVKVGEPSIIMGIFSITPRIDYFQGNDWKADISNLGDLHAPNLDKIGFQDLLIDRLIGGINHCGLTITMKKPAFAKTLAWMDYMTSFNKVYGDFADSLKFMVFAREFEYTYDENESVYKATPITSYINPEEFNYPFAKTSLTSQNYWVQIGIKMYARRVMAAKQIPTL